MKKNISERIRDTLFMYSQAYKIFDVDEIIRLIHDFPIREHHEMFQKVVTNKASNLNMTTGEYIKTEKIKNKLGNKGQNFTNWWNGHTTIERKSAICISFALKMDAHEANVFLSCLGYNGLYLRDYKDFIYAFCLNNKHSDSREKSFDKANTIIKKFSELNTVNYFPKNQGKNTNTTNNLANDIHNKRTEEELIEYLLQNKELFGTFNRNAYEQFMAIYSHIKTSDTKLSDITNDILMGIPSSNKSGITNKILEKITKDTLTDTMLSDIVSRRVQVKRKILILIWVLCYGCGKYGSNENFNDQIKKIDYGVLTACGMPTLDPRNPFDWLIINSIYYANTVDEANNKDTIERIKEVMDKLFG